MARPPRLPIRTRIALASATLAVVVVAATSARAFEEQRETARWVRHTFEVLDTLDVLQTHAAELQNGLRGFLLLGDAGERALHDRAAERLPGVQAALERLVSDSPKQTSEARSLREAVAAFESFAQEVFRLAQGTGPKAAIERVGSGEGRRRMLLVLGTLARMRAHEQQLLGEREEASRAGTVRVLGTLLVGSGVLLVLVVLAGMAVTSDFRARAEAEAHALEERERYRSLIDATSQAVWTNTPEGEMRGEQPGWSALTGQTPEQYSGFGWAEVVHPEDRARAVDAWKEAVREQRPYTVEQRVRRADGRWGHFAVRGVPVRDATGRVREWVGVHTDVTAERAAEAERERLIVALARSNRELDQFAYVASHDLKAPLRGIANLSAWLEEDLGSALTADTRRQMDLLRGRVHRLEALIDGILAYSRAGRVQGEVGEVDVAELFSEVKELLAPPPGAVVEAAGPLPRLWTERVPLQQVLMNLVGNALKYAGRPDPRVTLRAQRLGDQWDFTIQDNGPGIAPEFHERIWGIFQTLQARDAVEGTGIGLSVVRKLVESKGGRTWVTSTPGEGATFHVTWPADERRETARR